MICYYLYSLLALFNIILVSIVLKVLQSIASVSLNLTAMSKLRFLSSKFFSQCTTSNASYKLIS